jgi:hypothetical protein
MGSTVWTAQQSVEVKARRMPRPSVSHQPDVRVSAPAALVVRDLAGNIISADAVCRPTNCS